MRRALAARIAARWLHLGHIEALCTTKTGTANARTVELLEDARDRAHRRYLSAIKALAQVRRLLVPIVQVASSTTRVSSHPSMRPFLLVVLMIAGIARADAPPSRLVHATVTASSTLPRRRPRVLAGGWPRRGARQLLVRVGVRAVLRVAAPTDGVAAVDSPRNSPSARRKNDLPLVRRVGYAFTECGRLTPILSL